MAHRHEQLAREGFEAFKQGDLAKLDQIFADDAEWHSSGNGPVAGDFKGKEEIFANFGKVTELADSLEQNIHDILANDDHTVALISVKASRGTKKLDGNQVFVFHIEDDKVKSVWLHNYDDAAADEFWNE